MRAVVIAWVLFGLLIANVLGAQPGTFIGTIVGLWGGYVMAWSMYAEVKSDIEREQETH